MHLTGKTAKLRACGKHWQAGSQPQSLCLCVLYFSKLDGHLLEARNTVCLYTYPLCLCGVVLCFDTVDPIYHGLQYPILGILDTNDLNLREPSAS